jgi:hypothetical protein
MTKTAIHTIYIILLPVIIKIPSFFALTEDTTARNRSSSPTFVQEQEEIQQSFKKVLKDSSDEDEEQKSGIGGLFRPRQKSKEQKVQNWFVIKVSNFLFFLFSSI